MLDPLNQAAPAASENQEEPIIPAFLQSSEAFIRDLKVFSSLDSDALSRLVRDLPSGPGESMPAETLESITHSSKLDRNEVIRAAVVAQFLSARVKQSGKSGHDLRGEIEALLRREDATLAAADRIESLFSYTDEERREELAATAFSTPPTILSVDPEIIFKTGEGELLGGFLLTFNYLDGENNSKSLSVFANVRDMHEIGRRIKKAISTLEMHQESIKITP